MVKPSEEATIIAMLYTAWRIDHVTEDGVPRLLMDEAGDLTTAHLHHLAQRLQRLSTALRDIIETRKEDVDGDLR